MRALVAAVAVTALVVPGLAGCLSGPTSFGNGSTNASTDGDDDTEDPPEIDDGNNTTDPETPDRNESDDGTADDRPVFRTDDSKESSVEDQDAPVADPARSGCSPTADVDQGPVATQADHTFEVPEPVDPALIGNATVVEWNMPLDVALSWEPAQADLDLCLYAPNGSLAADRTGDGGSPTEVTVPIGSTDGWGNWTAVVTSTTAFPAAVTYGLTFNVTWELALEIESVPEAATGDVHTITIGADVSGPQADYEPAELTMPPGDGVRWTNDDDVGAAHSATTMNDPPESFDTGQLEAGETSETIYLFETGVYEYYCTVHGRDNMHAQVTVEEGAG